VVLGGTRFESPVRIDGDVSRGHRYQPAHDCTRNNGAGRCRF
jgi:hypothetical protein